MPTQEKKKKKNLASRHFRRWGGLRAHTRKKKLSIFAAGGGYAHTRKKNLGSEESKKY